MLFILLIFFGLLGATTIRHTHAPTEPPPYCYLNSGCAVLSNCQCPTTFTYCETKDDSSGTCQFTTVGVLVLSAICIGSVLFVVFCFICCCCCRRASDTYHHTTVNYLPPSYAQHNQL